MTLNREKAAVASAMEAEWTQWTVDEALKWADTWCAVMDDVGPTTGDQVALNVLAKEVLRLRAELAGLEALRRQQEAGRDYWAADAMRLRAAATKARAALSDSIMTRDGIVYADALRALDDALQLRLTEDLR